MKDCDRVMILTFGTKGNRDDTDLQFGPGVARVGAIPFKIEPELAKECIPEERHGI
jgi:hypothetical protein